MNLLIARAAAICLFFVFLNFVTQMICLFRHSISNDTPGDAIGATLCLKTQLLYTVFQTYCHATKWK